MSPRLALGSVQFGMPYGVANRAGQVSAGELGRILALAREAGMDTLDTAIGYGTSEEALGLHGVRDWRVITKIGQPPAGCENISDWCLPQIEGSLRRLRLDALAGVLIHDPAVLDGPDGEHVFASLLLAKSRGLTEKVGYSIYAPDILDRRYELYKPDLVQAPLNVFDRRLESSGWLRRLQKEGVEVHARSAFLQGLLLMAKGDRPAYFNRWSEHFENWHRWQLTSGVSAVSGALAYLMNLDGVVRIVVGVDSAAQLQDILVQSRSMGPVPPPMLAITDPDLIDPSQWSK